MPQRGSTLRGTLAFLVGSLLASGTDAHAITFKAAETTKYDRSIGKSKVFDSPSPTSRL